MNIYPSNVSTVREERHVGPLDGAHAHHLEGNRDTRGPRTEPMPTNRGTTGMSGAQERSMAANRTKSSHLSWMRQIAISFTASGLTCSMQTCSFLASTTVCALPAQKGHQQLMNSDGYQLRMLTDWPKEKIS